MSTTATAATQHEQPLELPQQFKPFVITPGVYPLLKPQTVDGEPHGFVKVFEVHHLNSNSSFSACWLVDPRESGVRTEEPAINLHQLINLINWELMLNQQLQQKLKRMMSHS